MQGFLTTEEIIILKEAYRAAQHKKQADRIKTILLLNQGLAYEKITKLLLLDDSTLRRYYREYKQAGIDGLLEDHYYGSNPLLTKRQHAQQRSAYRNLNFVS